MQEHRITSRRGASLVTTIIGCTVAGVLICTAFILLGNIKSESTKQPILDEVSREDFIWTILDQGDVASSANVELICEVASKDWNGTPVLEVIAEGTHVKPGDIVCKLDDASLRLDEEQQLIKVNEADAATAEAKSLLESTREEQREYFEGTFLRERQKLSNDLFQAQQQLSETREYYNFSRRMWAKGFLTDLQLEADEFAVKKAENAVALAMTDINLLEEHTFAKKTIEFESKIYSAEKALENASNNYDVEVKVLERIRHQIDKCVIRVPEGQEGQVVYPDRWDPYNDRKFIMQAGSMIRENEVVVMIPDPDQMQVDATVGESQIVHVKKGMPAKIRVDALPGRPLAGTVVYVGEYAEQDDWLSSAQNKYSVKVEFDDPPSDLKPGMNASISIIAEEHANVLTVPLQGVFENGEKTYALVRNGDEWQTREVTIGSANESKIHILKGLEAGDQVALNGRAYPDLLDIELVDTH